MLLTAKGDPALKPRQATQFDVAKAAGVSRSTVSLILNGRDRGRIPPQTRERVLAAMRELNYHPNWAARALVRRSNRVVGVFTYEPLFPYEQDDFFYPFLLGIERQATREGYHLLLFTRNEGSEGPRGIYREDGNVLSLVDGAVLMGRHPDHDEIRRLIEEGRTFVYIGRREIPGCDFDWVAPDYRSGAREATQRLIALGHRRIGYIGTSAGAGTYDADRLAGCRDAAGAHPDVSLIRLPDAVLGEGPALVEAIRRERLSALVCNSNETMAVVLPHLQAASVAVPDRLSLVSLTDDRVDLPPGVVPSGIQLNRADVGAEALRLLVQRLSGMEGPPEHRLIPCLYRDGNTVAAPVQTL